MLSPTQDRMSVLSGRQPTMNLSFMLLLLHLLGCVELSLSQNAPRDCGRPPALADADTKTSLKETYRHNEKVEFVCQNYYVMEGGPFKTCNNGEWTGHMTCLRPCTVDSDAMNRHNIRFKYGRHNKLYSTHNDHIEFSCTRGRPSANVAMRQMCVNGVINLPTCQ